MTWNILGNETAVAFLKEHTRPEKLRHAYLITGPQGVGRKTLALAFIKALNCTNPPSPGEFCNACLSCRQINTQTFPDLTVLTPAENAKDLKIDQVRVMQQSLSLAPYQSKYRIVLIPDFQRATAGASNALLKSLEEPPARAVIILTADAKESLLETISSRCELLRLRPLPVDEAAQGLIAQYGLTEERAKLLAHLSAGRIGAAVCFDREQETLESYTQSLNDLEELLSGNKRFRLQYVERLSRQKGTPREKFRQLIGNWLTFWRDVMIARSGADLPMLNLEKSAIVQAVASQMTSVQIEELLRLHENAIGQLDAYVNPRLVIEYVLLSMPKVTLVS